MTRAKSGTAPTSLEVLVSFSSLDPERVEGTVTAADGVSPGVPFVGWIALVGALERALARTAPEADSTWRQGQRPDVGDGEADTLDDDEQVMR